MLAIIGDSEQRAEQTLASSISQSIGRAEWCRKRRRNQEKKVAQSRKKLNLNDINNNVMDFSKNISKKFKAM